jgi:hypothetical protein
LLRRKSHPLFPFLLGGIQPYLLVILVDIYPRNIQENVWKLGRMTVAVSMMRALSGSKCLRKKISLSHR